MRRVVCEGGGAPGGGNSPGDGTGRGSFCDSGCCGCCCGCCGCCGCWGGSTDVAAPAVAGPGGGPSSKAADPAGGGGSGGTLGGGTATAWLRVATAGATMSAMHRANAAHVITTMRQSFCCRGDKLAHQRAAAEVGCERALSRGACACVVAPRRPCGASSCDEDAWAEEDGRPCSRVRCSTLSPTLPRARPPRISNGFIVNSSCMHERSGEHAPGSHTIPHVWLHAPSSRTQGRMPAKLLLNWAHTMFQTRPVK